MPEKIDLDRMNWSEIEAYLAHDTRIVIPLGATEEHGSLSVSSDTLFVREVTGRACVSAGVLAAPAMPFGCSAFAIGYPGTISLRTVTLALVIEDMVDCLYRQGFRRLIFVTGHGGNEAITGVLSEVQLDRPQLNVYYHNAWEPMRDKVRDIEISNGLPVTEHAAWNEEFAFTRVAPIANETTNFPVTPDFPLFPLNPRTARSFLGLGVVSGVHTLGSDSISTSLLDACVSGLEDLLKSLPRHSATA